MKTEGEGIHALVTDSVAVWNDSVPAVGNTLGYSIKTISNLDCQLFILNIAIVHQKSRNI